MDAQLPVDVNVTTNIHSVFRFVTYRVAIPVCKDTAQIPIDLKDIKNFKWCILF